jgi:hypothetical protein
MKEKKKSITPPPNPEHAMSTWLAYARNEKEIRVDYNAEPKKKEVVYSLFQAPIPSIVHRLLVIA